MAYPPSYERDYSFTEFESLNPGQPKPGAALDTEFDDVSVALTATQDALALIQRDDGKLANDSVGEDQLQDDVFDGIVDGITAEAEAARDAAAASASAAADSATAASASANAALTSEGNAAGSAALAGTSQTIAQSAADEAALSAAEAATHEANAELAANETAGSVAETQAAVDLAYKWAEYLAAPVMPAPDGYPEAVDDGMWSSKWWALRARDYSGFTPVDFGSSGAADIGDAYDDWVTAGGELPPGNVLAEWNGVVYWLIDPSDPSDPASWIRITGDTGPPGPANELTIGTVTTLPPGSPATATITGTPPTQVLDLGIPQGATGSGGTGAGGNPTALVGLTAIPGVATTLIRSDGAPAINQAIAPTWTAQHIFANAGKAFIVQSATPDVYMNETGAALNEKLWRHVITGGTMYFGTRTDADGTGANWMQVDRTGTVVDSVTFPSQAIFSRAAASLISPSVLISSSRPSIALNESDAVVDNQYWLREAQGGVLTEYCVSNSGGASSPWLTVTRTGPTASMVTLPTQVAFTNATRGFTVQAAVPNFYIDETDAALNERMWRIVASDGTLYFDTRLDAGGAGNIWMQVDRTGVAIDSVTFPAQAIFTQPATATADSIKMQSATPLLAWYANGGVADEKRWDLYSSGKFLVWRIANDAGSSQTSWMTVQRTGMVVDSVTFTATAVVASGYLNAIGGKLYLGNWETITNLGDGYLRLNHANQYSIGVYTPTAMIAGTWMRSLSGISNPDQTKYLAWGPAGTYGGCYVTGAVGGFHGIGIYDGVQNPVFMSNGTSLGIYLHTDAKWLINRESATQAMTSYNFVAPSFNATSSRAIKRETGKPTRAADILSRLRPILYRLLADEDREQLGMIAEEVHEVCPQMSDGKSISYDRLAILLLADWQEKNVVA